MIYLLISVLLFISLFNVNTQIGEDHLLCKWSLVMALATIIASYKIYKKYHLSLGLLFCYFCLSGIYTFQWPLGYYFGYDNVIRVIIQHSSLLAVISIISVTFIIDNIKFKDIEKLKYFFILLTVINSSYVIFQFINGNTEFERGGLFRNVSTNGCIIGACYPLLLHYLIYDNPLKGYRKLLSYLICLGPILAVLASKSSVAIGVVAVALSSFFFMNIINKRNKIILGMLMFFSIIFSGYLVNPKHMFYDSKRFGLYKIQYDAWQKQGQHFLGYGTGSYKFFGVRTQMEKEYMLKKTKSGTYKGYLNQWLHNDWLQLFLENGILGALLILNALFFLLIRAWKHKTIFSCLITYMSAMVFHYPIHYPIHALFGVWLIAYIMIKYNGMSTLQQIKRGEYA